jgi:hypothetical protein
MILENRNADMVTRIEAAPVRYPFRFTFVGDSGAKLGPESNARFSALLDQMLGLDPPPAFFVAVGDFAGPGDRASHLRYLDMVERLPFPNLVVMGNHDRDDPAGWELFPDIHGGLDYQFAYGNTRFICINSHSCNGGRPGSRVDGPRDEDLAYLEKSLREDDHPVRIVMLHQPPDLAGHFAPPLDPGFRHLEREFLRVVKAYRVSLVCAAHIVLYDYTEHEGIPYIVSAGGGWGLYPEFGKPVDENPPYRGSFYGFTEVTVQESGALSWRVFRLGQGTQPDERYSVGLY